MRRVITDKGDHAQPDVRARLVAHEMATHCSDAFFASTPPLEATRLHLSHAATKKKTPAGRYRELHFICIYIYIKKAYFNRIQQRTLHLCVHKELGPHMGPSPARKDVCVFGTRDAGKIWEETYAQALLDLGFRRGLSSPCSFSRRIFTRRWSCMETTSVLWDPARGCAATKLASGGCLS